MNKNSKMDVYLRSDAEKLLNAISDPSTNKLNEVIEMLGRKTPIERLAIISKCNEIKNSPIIDHLKKKKLENKFETPIHFYAAELNYAFKKTNSDIIIHILCPLSNEEWEQLQVQYEKDFQITLEEEIKTGFKELLRQLLLKLCQRGRATDDGQVTLTDDVKALAKEENPYDDEADSVFPKILAKRSFPQIKKISDEFGKTQKNSFVQHVKEKIIVPVDCEGFSAIIEFSEDRIKYNASCLTRAFKTKDITLIGIVLIRNDDLSPFKNIY